MQTYSRNPQTIVDTVDNFIQNMWKFDFLHLFRWEIHIIVDNIVNYYIQHPHWKYRHCASVRRSFLHFFNEISTSYPHFVDIFTILWISYLFLWKWCGYVTVQHSAPSDQKLDLWAAWFVRKRGGWDASSYREAILHGLMLVTGSRRLNCYVVMVNLFNFSWLQYLYGI